MVAGFPSGGFRPPKSALVSGVTFPRPAWWLEAPAPRRSGRRWGVGPEKGGGAGEGLRGAGARRGQTLHLPVPSAERAVLGAWADRVGLSPVVLVRYALRVGVHLAGQWSPGDFLQRTARGPTCQEPPAPSKGPMPAVETSRAPAGRVPVQQARVAPAAPATSTARAQAQRSTPAGPAGPNPVPARSSAPAVCGSPSGMPGGPVRIPSPPAITPSEALPGPSGGVPYPGPRSYPVPPAAGSWGFAAGRPPPWKR